MRLDDVARGVVLPLDVLDGDIDPELMPLELEELPLAPDVVLDEPLDVSDADPLDVPDVVPPVLLEPLVDGLVDVDGLLIDDPLVEDPLDDEPLDDGLLVDGLLRFTSPLDVPVVVPLCALPVVGVQGAELIPVPDVEEVVPEDIPEVALIPLVLPLALAVVLPAAPVPLVPALVDDGVPVPFAPLVLFRPVKR
jgi:hypothetical protein